MAVTDESRFRLHQRLGEVLGEHEAATLMEHLPPVGWADVATKRDLDHVQVLMRRDLDAAVVELRGDLHLKLEQMRGDLIAQQRNHTLGLMAVNGTIAALAIAAVQLI